MKIALITYHHSANYGAVLQTYATVSILKELGHEVSIIDIRQKEEVDFYKKIFFFIKNYNFYRFRKKYYPNYTEHYKTLSKLQKKPPIADVYIVGSDQVWNLDISKSLTEAYFLNFGSREIKRISYASSFGKDDLKIEDSSLKDILEESLSRFNALSVREKSAVAICKEIFNCEAQLVLDPTLLVNYKNFITNKKIEREIVCYQLIRDNSFFKIAKYVSTEMDLSLKLINSIYPIRGFKYMYPPSIEKWLESFFNSSFIITDSYHGVLFSLIFRKKFIALTSRPKQITRIKSILEITNLENRLFSSIVDLKDNNFWKEDIDYKIIDMKIELLRQNSINFLKDALK